MRLFTVCDIHGSNVLFKKFVNAAKYNVYGAQAILCNGDLTGKAVVPLVGQPDGSFLADLSRVNGRKQLARTSQEVEDLERFIGDMGLYSCRITADEVAELHEDQKKLDALFHQLMIERIRLWLRIAEERLKDTKVLCIMMPGNDDPEDLGAEINKSTVIQPEGKVVEFDGGLEMASCGYSNMTPWDTPRQCSEKELLRKLEDSIGMLKDPSKGVFNFHCPPYDSGLDIAPQLDADRRPVLRGGELVMIPVGSTAVRKTIEQYQPALGLHGHIHESPKAVNIGRTLCVNPGSEYQQGILRGYVIDVDTNGVQKYVRVEG